MEIGWKHAKRHWVLITVWVLLLLWLSWRTRHWRTVLWKPFLPLTKKWEWMAQSVWSRVSWKGKSCWTVIQRKKASCLSVVLVAPIWMSPCNLRKILIFRRAMLPWKSAWPAWKAVTPVWIFIWDVRMRISWCSVFWKRPYAIMGLVCHLSTAVRCATLSRVKLLP